MNLQRFYFEKEKKMSFSLKIKLFQYIMYKIRLTYKIIHRWHKGTKDKNRTFKFNKITKLNRTIHFSHIVLWCWRQTHRSATHSANTKMYRWASQTRNHSGRIRKTSSYGNTQTTRHCCGTSAHTYAAKASCWSTWYIWHCQKQ